MPRPATRAQVGTAVSRPISNFARVSKGHASLDPAIKKIALEPATSRKRKASYSIEEETHPRLTRRTVSFPPSSDDELAAPVKRARRQEPTSTPSTKARVVTKGKRTAKAAPKRTETAHKPIESTIIAKSREQGKKVQTKIDRAFKKLGKPIEEGKDDALPSQGAELDGLNKAFLKTIMIHIAHNGIGSPIAVNAIIPHITRNWGKRKVTINDIRRCITLQSSPNDGLASQYTFNITTRDALHFIEATPGSHAPGIPNEIHRIHAARNNSPVRDGSGVDTSLAQIPLSDLSLGDAAAATIQASYPLAPPSSATHTSKIPLQPLKIVGESHRRSIQRLYGNGPGGIGREPEKDKAVMLNPDGTKMNLLDRLRYKQLAKANGPATPSPAELQRRAALNRVSDVAATISMLSLSNPISLPRQAFTMAVILEKLRDSMRTPMSKEEGAACVRLIASEVAPEWLRIVTIGGRDNVVVQRGGQPVDRVIQERVQKLMA